MTISLTHTGSFGTRSCGAYAIKNYRRGLVFGAPPVPAWCLENTLDYMLEGFGGSRKPGPKSVEHWLRERAKDEGYTLEILVPDPRTLLVLAVSRWWVLQAAVTFNEDHEFQP